MSTRTDGTDTRPGLRAERRGELLDVALRLFYEKGYERTSLQDIASEMGFTKAAIYYYADSKEELLVDIYRRIVEPAITSAREIADGPGSGAERFTRLVETHLRVFLANVEANAVFEIQRDGLSPAAAETVRRHGREYGSILSTVYSEGVADGSLRRADPKVTVNAVLGLCNSVHRWFDPRGARTVDELVAELTDLIGVGIDRR
ncbi:MAG: TetR/AcrR family transcriptional regulator [Acidimicrobiales bacterium]